MNLCDNDTTNATYRIGPITERPIFTSVFQIETKDDYGYIVLRDEPGQTFHPRATFTAASYQCKKRMQRKMADSDGGGYSLIMDVTVGQKRKGFN